MVWWTARAYGHQTKKSLFEEYQKWAESGKSELDYASYTNTSQEPSTVDLKKFSELNISLDKSAVIKNQSSFHQISTSRQSKDNNYLQDVLNVLGPYPFDCPPGFRWVLLHFGNLNWFETSQMKMQ